MEHKFEVGDNVLYSKPSWEKDKSHALVAAKIVEIYASHMYNVEFHDGSKKLAYDHQLHPVIH